jgi:putative transposase
MPNHFHALLTPGSETSLEKAMMMIKGGSAHRLKQENEYRLPVWQKGFHDRWIRNVIEYKARMSYVASNSVTASLAETPADYQWSSAAGAFAMDSSVFD